MMESALGLACMACGLVGTIRSIQYIEGWLGLDPSAHSYWSVSRTPNASPGAVLLVRVTGYTQDEYILLELDEDLAPANIQN